MSVHRVEIQSHGQDHLQKALDLVLTSPSSSGQKVHAETVTGWKVLDRVMVFGHSGDGFTAFPCGMSAANLMPIIEAWLGDQKYPPPPPWDGDSVKGFLIKTMVGYAGKFSVEPEWVHYGK